jgi:hypothetical protein
MIMNCVKKNYDYFFDGMKPSGRCILIFFCEQISLCFDVLEFFLGTVQKCAENWEEVRSGRGRGSGDCVFLTSLCVHIKKC